MLVESEPPPRLGHARGGTLAEHLKQLLELPSCAYSNGAC